MGRRLLAFSTVALFLTGCSAAKFSSNKNDVLAKNSVFGSEDDSTGRIRQPGGGTDGTGRFPQFPNGGEFPGQINQLDEVSVTLVCSDNDSEDATNFKRALASGLPVELRVNNTLCTTNAQTIQTLILKPKITRADLTPICAAAMPAATEELKLTAIVNGDANTTSSSGKFEVLYANNKDFASTAYGADANCDKRSSPLVVHTASDIENPLPIALSSQEDGVDFDLLGYNNDFEKVRVSWFTNSEYRFLALPNRKGEVRGIEELFGDNTSGPDGKFADNGYEALAKFDGTSADGAFRLAEADGLIDRNDPVFHRLRLWLDKNRDGIGQAGEMRTLSSAGIVFIDLDYSTDYAEVDQYGNETKMKSVVGYRNGSLDLIFDLWFSYRHGGN